MKKFAVGILSLASIAAVLYASGGGNPVAYWAPNNTSFAPDPNPRFDDQLAMVRGHVVCDCTITGTAFFAAPAGVGGTFISYLNVWVNEVPYWTVAQTPWYWPILTNQDYGKDNWPIRMVQFQQTITCNPGDVVTVQVVFADNTGGTVQGYDTSIVSHQTPTLN